jgi:hypothetical protein
MSKERSTTEGAESPWCRRKLWILAATLFLVAAAWGGWNAWNEQQGRTAPLDLDGWGHLVVRQESSGRDFFTLFRDPSLWKGPVVPFVFGLCYFLAPFPESVLVFNVLAFALAAGLLFVGFCALGARRWAAFCAVLLWVFYLPHQMIFGYYYAEPLIALFGAGLFFLAGKVVRKASPWTALGMGILGGFLVLARAPFLLVVVGLPVVLLFHLGPQRVRFILLYAFGFLATFAPWPIRNLAVEGELIPFTTEGGKILFQGTYLPGDDMGWSTLQQDARFRQIEAGELDKNPIEQYHYWKELATDQIRQDPVGQLQLCVRKALRFWIYLPQHSWLPNWKTTLVALFALPLGVLGLVRGRGSLLVQLCGLWVGGLWLFHAVIHAELRYNFPVLPMLFLLAFIGLIGLMGPMGLIHKSHRSH